MRMAPLRSMATVWTSSVDKHMTEGELPVQLCNYVNAYKNDRVRPGPHLMRATATPEEIARNRLNIGDTVFTKDSEDPADIGISAYVDGEESDFVCGYHLAIARPNRETHPRYLTWALRSRHALDHFSNSARGISRYGLGLSDIRSTPLPRHDSREQQRIADFLDDRVARIDHIVAARQAQRELVVEGFRSRLASKLAPSARSRALKGLLTDVTSGPRGWGDRVGNKGPAFVRITNLRPLGIELNREDLARVDAPPGAEMARATLSPGDVLLSITAVFGRVAVWREGGGAFSQHVARLRPLNVLDADWIAWILQSRSLYDQYLLYGYGGTKVGLGLDHVRNLQVPDIPPVVRQEQARDLGVAWNDTEQVTQAFRASITRLREYKQSLITAAVTGELDVTTASTKIPE